MESNKDVDELDLDFVGAHVTTWSRCNSRRSRNKTYGRTATQKKEARRRIKTNAIDITTTTNTTTQLSVPDAEPFPAPATTTPEEKEGASIVVTQQGSSSSLSSFEFNPSIPKPKPFKTLARSRSFTGTKRVPFDRSSRSLSSDASFQLTSDSEFEAENRNPNVTNLLTPPQLRKSANLQQMLSPMDEHPKLRPRKVRHIHDVGDLANSFSSLAKTSEACTWNDDFPAVEAVSPAISEVSSTLGSSRKRGICCSLDISIIEEGEARDPQGHRTRMFSLDNDSVRPLKDAGSHSTRKGRRMATQLDSDDGLTSESDTSFNANDMSCDHSTDDAVFFPKRRSSDNESTDEKLLPPIMRRSSKSKNAEESVFGASRKKSAVTTADSILESMTSVSDLRFLVRGLRNEERVGRSFGYSSNWNVTLPNKWDSNRRLALIRWACNKLGFTTRAGGGNCLFMSIPPTKGATLLATLERAYLLWKDRQEVDKQRQERKKLDGPAGMVFCIAESIQIQPSPLQPATKSVTKSESLKSSLLDDTLAQAVGALNISKDSLETEGNGRNRGAKSTEQQHTDEEAEAEDAALVRHVTLEPVQSCSQSFDQDDVFDLLPPKPSRYSGEHHVGGADLVSHLHGLSPVPSGRSMRPPKLTIPGPRVAGGLAMASPFPRSAGGSVVPFGCFETPQVKKGFWQSNSNCHDWGVSKCCPQEILDVLMERFEAQVEAAGIEMSEFCEELPLSISPRYSSEVIASVSAKADLGLDHEVVEDYDDNDESDISKAAKEEEEEEEENDDDDIADLTTRPVANWRRRSSVGATALAGLRLDESQLGAEDDKAARKRKGSMAKHKRVSLCVNSFMNSRPTTRATRPSFLTGYGISMVAPGIALSNKPPLSFVPERVLKATVVEDDNEDDLVGITCSDEGVLHDILSYLDEKELLCCTSLVSTKWANMSREAHASLMLLSVGCAEDEDDGGDDDEFDIEERVALSSIEKAMEKPWKYLVNQYPWACFLSEGAYKKVYKVWNAATQALEAMSVMDVDLIESTGNKRVVGAELAVSALLSSLVRRRVCPNFVLTRRVFTCPFEPPSSYWGSTKNKRPKGAEYVPESCSGRKPREPSQKKRGRFQYMRMELCNEGDAEEYIKRLPGERMDLDDAQKVLFQVAFALHVAADQFSLKHYDLKLLNVFMNANPHETEQTVLRYGLGSHTFALKMTNSLVAKVADYGTANVQAESNGQPATIGQFTTLENTPPEFMILGDAATQGHGHDSFGLGLCMLHLHTGHAPYEEILEGVRCPPGLRQKLESVWVNQRSTGYSILRSIILSDTYTDEDGNVEGEPAEVFYDTLYRFLVLFGVPDEKYKMKEHGKVWKAISSCLEKRSGRRGGPAKGSDDRLQFEKDQEIYSVLTGSNEYIARARKSLEDMDGGLDLLFSLVNFDPEKRASACDVLNSDFMSSLREARGTKYPGCNVMNYMTYATS